MAGVTAWTNKGKFESATSLNLDTDATLELVLFDVAQASVAAAEDINFVSEVTVNECSGTGYARKACDLTVTEDDTNNEASADCTDFSYAGADFGTVEQACLIRYTGSDATSPVIAWITSADFPIVTNGGQLDLTVDATGLLALT